MIASPVAKMLLGKPYRNACIAAVIQMNQKMRVAAHDPVKSEYCKPPERDYVSD